MSDGLNIEVGIKNARFQAGLQQMRGQAQKFGSDIGGMLAGSFGNITKAFTAGAVVGAFSKIISQATEIKKLSDQFGVNAQALQRVGNGLAKGNLDAVAPLLNKLIINQEKAREGNKNLTASFTTLGISAAELNSLSPDELLFRIADGTKNAADRGAAYNAVVSILGKTAGVFFGKLEKGSDAIKANADATGIYSDKAIASFAGFNKQVGVLKSNVLPVLADIGAWLLRIGGLGVQVGKSMAWNLPKDLIGKGEGRKGAISRFYGKVDDLGGKIADEVGLGWIGGKKEKGGKEKPGKHPSGVKAEGFSGDADEPTVGGGGDNAQTRINALEAQHGKLLDEQYDKSLNSTQLINTLTERKVRLEQEAAAADKEGDKEESLKKQNAALELGVKLTEEKHRVSQEIATTAERLAAIERESHLAGMTAETRIKALAEERARLLREANLAQLMGDPAKAGTLRVKAAERERDVVHETKRMEAERAQVTDALFANEEQRRMKTMSAEEKILTLTEQRQQLLKEAHAAVAPGKDADYDLYGKKQLEASEKQKEINSAVEEKKAQDKQHADEAARLKQEHDDQAKQDEQQIAAKEKEERERQIALLPAEQQKAIRTKEKQAIDKERVGVKAELANEKDPDKQRKLRAQMADLNLQSDEKADQISDLAKQKKQAAFSVTATSLQRAGGGGRAYGPASDPAMRAREKTNQLLQKILDQKQKPGTTGTLIGEPY